ncbi:MAG: D-alanyl-D-alanine carboxypeptidase, partial [Lentisphaeria bacterium]|nr:D-alanyl-D-alanine carboxypeptidase [Lentisphaeria bacterium]
WLDPGKEQFTVRELLLGVAVKSANDAATQLGERVGGSVENFVARMNKRAGELGMKSSVFYNPCGLTDKRRGNSKSSAADMVILGERLLEYPFLMEMCSTKQASIRDGKTVFTTTNKLIAPHYPGVDGLKTGYIRAAGSCLTFSVLRGNRRIVGCVTGFTHAKDRDYFCRRLIDWAYDPQSVNKPRPGSGRKSAPGRKSSGKKSNKKSRSK